MNRGMQLVAVISNVFQTKSNVRRKAPSEGRQSGSDIYKHAQGYQWPVSVSIVTCTVLEINILCTV